MHPRQPWGLRRPRGARAEGVKLNGMAHETSRLKKEKDILPMPWTRAARSNSDDSGEMRSDVKSHVDHDVYTPPTNSSRKANI